MTVRCKVCLDSHELSPERVIAFAEITAFVAAHDHECYEFDMVYDMSRREA